MARSSGQQDDAGGAGAVARRRAIGGWTVVFGIGLAGLILRSSPPPEISPFMRVGR